jgi:hypothetical protein
MDKLSQEEVDKMTKEERQSYDARSQIGDIIVVRPDGWVWGREECLPNFIVVKVPDMTLEEAKKYEESLSKTEIIDDKPVTTLLKVRKYQIPLADVDDAKTKNGILTKTKAQKINNIKEKIS